MSSLTNAIKNLGSVSRAADLRTIGSIMQVSGLWNGVQFGVVRGLENAPRSAQFLNQTHSDTVHWIDKAPHELVNQRLDGDAMLSKSLGIICAVKTADCIPLLLWNPTTKTIGGCHAGWRGLVANIAQKWIRKADFFGESCVFIGPCISTTAFEVGLEVIEFFLDKFELDAGLKGLCILRGNENKWHLDLQTAAALQLIETGVEPRKIFMLASCTKTHAHLWESYRRDGSRCGSNVTWIQAG